MESATNCNLPKRVAGAGLRITILILLAVVGLPTLFAQTGSIVGTLADSTNAVLPNGTVTVKEQSTGAVLKAQSNEAGFFRVLNVLPGTYTLRAEAASFKALELKDIVVTVAETRDLGNLKLQIGTQTEEVSVTAAATPVQTASSETSALIDSRQLSDVALKGRDIFGMMQLLPGVVDANTDRSLASAGSSVVSINGAATGTRAVTFDGANETDQGGNNSIFVNPSMDAVSEVKVMTGASQAQYGRSSGGGIYLVTKSGSREFHGSAFWQHRNEDMNANTFFNNRQNIQKPLYRYFIGGGTIGGPVYIPKVFNSSKEKLFFFWSEEITRVALPTITKTANLPTVAERAGDFSQSRASNGSVITIKDPDTGLPFPGNIIPSSRISPIGQGILNLFQKPNGYVNPAAGQQYTANFIASATPPFDRRDDIVRGDWNIRPNMLLYARFGKDKNDQGGEFAASPGVGPYMVTYHGYQAVGHIINTFSPTVVNDIMVGYGDYRYGFARTNGDQNSNYYRTSTLNPPLLRPIPSGEDYLPYLPNASFSGGSVSNPGALTPQSCAGLGYGTPNPCPYANYNTDITIQDDLTKVWGNHSFRAGFTWEQNAKYEPMTGGTDYAGSYNFGSSTSNPVDTGHGYANALLGIFQTYTESSVRIFPVERFRTLEAYVQDSWKVTRRLTLEYGVRFYKEGLPVDQSVSPAYANFYPQLWVASKAARIYRPALVNGKSVALDPLTNTATYAALQNTIIPNSGDVVNGVHLNGLTGNGDFTSLPAVVASPRFGFAWDVTGNGKTAIRASFGTFFQRPDSNWLPGRGAAPTLFAPVVYYTTFTGLTQAAQAAALSPAGETVVYGDQKVPRSHQFNLNVQRDIGFGVVLNVGYAGNFDRHAMTTRQINPVPLGAYADPNNLFQGTEINANLLRTRFPGMGSINYQSDSLSDLNYHALQVSANRRMTHGLQFGLSYVFSKALGTQGSDEYHVDRQWYYGPTSTDRRHNLNFNWVYQIPGTSTPVLRSLLSNWTLSGVATAQTGAPVSPTCKATSGAVTLTDPTLSGATARCKVVGDPNAFTPSFYQTFNASAFTLADPGTFGTAGLNTLNQPSFWNLDVTLARRIPLGKDTRRAINFRIEGYNVLNHTEFSTIGTSLQLSGGTNLSTTWGQYTATRPARVLSTTLRLEF